LPPAQPKNGAIRRFALPISSIAASPQGNFFYVATTAGAGPLGNYIYQFDPNAGAFSSPVYVGSNPALLTVAGDGNSLFAELAGADSIAKLTLPDLKTIYQFPITNKTGNWTSALQLESLPGTSDSLVVSQFNDVSPWELTTIYDAGTKRPNTTRDWAYDPSTATTSLVSSFQVSPDGTTLWGSDTYSSAATFSNWRIGPSGLTETATSSYSIEEGWIHCQSGFCFAEGGLVYNASTLQPVGTFGQFGTTGFPGGSAWTLPDLANKRVFYASSSGIIQAFAFDPAHPAVSQTPIGTYSITPNFQEPINSFFIWNDELVLGIDTELTMIPISAVVPTQ
jgi:hypothetical protein